MSRNGHNGKRPTKRELRDLADRTVALADKTVGLTKKKKGAYSVDEPRNVGSVEPGSPSSVISTIPSATLDPVRAEGNWAPFRPAPKPVPGIVEGYKPGKDVIGESQWGGTGTPITAGFLTDLGEYNQDVFGRAAVATYEKMRRGDAQVWGTLMAVKGPLQSATWDIEPGVKANDPGYEKAKEVAEFVKDNIFGGLEFQTSTGGWSSQAWDQVIWNALLCLDFGVSIHEDVYRVDGNYLKLRGLVPLLPITFYRWHTEIDGYTLISLEQYGYRGIEFINATVPAEKICRFTLNQEGSNFWGLSLLRSSYPHWFIKNQLYRIDAIASERNGLGVPVITLAKGASAQDRAVAFDFVTKLSAHEMTGLVLPEGSTFEIKSVVGQPRDLSKMIEHHNRMISTTALAMFMTIGSAPHGSRATAATQHDFFLAASQHLATYIGNRVTANTIRRLTWLNFGEDAIVPTLIAKNVKMRDFEDVREALQKLAQTGLLVSDKPLRDLIRDEYELPEETDEGVVTTAGEQVTDESGNLIPPPAPPAQAGTPEDDKNKDKDGKQQKTQPPMTPADKKDSQRAKQQKGVQSKSGAKKPVNDNVQASDTPFARTDGVAENPDRAHLSELPDPTIYFVRHGETADDVNPEDQIISSWSDTPLTDKGRAEAQQAGEALKGKGVAEIYASDLPRSLETAQIIAGIIDAEVIEDRGLRGWNVGAYSGRSAKDVLPNDRTISEELAWLAKHPKVKPPMGDNWQQTEARISDAVERAIQRAETLGKPIAVVSHSRVIDRLPTFSRGEIVDEDVKGPIKTHLGTIHKATQTNGEWNFKYNAKQLSDAGYHSIGDDVIVANKNNRSGQPTQRNQKKKTRDDAPPPDTAQEQHPATSSPALEGQAPTRHVHKPKNVPVEDVMAKQAGHGARRVVDDKQEMRFTPSASQERQVSLMPDNLQPEDKQDTPLTPTPETYPSIETFAHAGKRSISAVVGKKKKGSGSMVMQTLIFPKKSWKSKTAVKSWLKSHGKKTEIDETESSYRARQQDPGDFESKSFRTIELNSENLSDVFAEPRRVFFEQHHGEEAAEDLRKHYAALAQQIAGKIKNVLKHKVIAAIAKQAVRQLKAGVPVPELHFVRDPHLEGALDEVVATMYKRASEQAKKEVHSKRKR